MSYRFCLNLLVAIGLLGAGASAHALMIGNLQTISYLGEPLHVRIEVVAHDDAALQNGCFRLAGPSSLRPPLNHSRLELENIGGKHYVAISTRTPVDDPILDLSLRAEDCGPNIEKDFVVLLSPKGVESEQPEPPKVKLPQASVSTMPAASSSKRSIRHGAQRRVSPRRLARRPYHRHHRPRRHHRHHLRKSRHYSFLRLDDDVDSFAISADRIAASKKHTPTNVIGNAMQAKAAGLGDMLVLHPPQQDASAQSQTKETGNSAVGSQAGNGAGGPSPQRRPAAAPAAAPEQTGTSSFWHRHSFTVAYFTLLVLVLVLMVALMLKKRSVPKQFESQHSPWPEDFTEGQMEETPRAFPLAPSLLEGELPEIRLDESGISAAGREKPDEPAVAARPENPDVMPELMQPGEFAIDRTESTGHVLEMAEVMLAFGQSKQAIDILSQFIDSNPDQAVEPWIKLLELYFQADLREEFEALALDLHRRFNVAIPQWQHFEQEQGAHIEKGELTLESLPHIMEHLTSTWNTPDCLSYLNKLIADNRGGQRQGFSLPLVRDILLLREILRQSGQIPQLVH